MAITEVGSGSQRAASGTNNNVDSATLAFPGNVTAGSLLVVAGAVWNTSAAPSSVAVTDTIGNTYTVVLGDIPSGLTWRTFIAYAISGSSAACTVTVNPGNASDSFSWSQDEFAGVDATPASVNGGTSTGAANPLTGFTASDSITTATANELIIGVMSHDIATRALTAGSGYTTIGENETNSNNQCHHAVFRLATTAQAYTVSVDAASDVNPGTVDPGWAMQTHSFLEDDGGGAAPTKPWTGPGTESLGMLFEMLNLV